MSRAIIRDGRWVREDGESLDPVELNQVHAQINRIHEFAKDVVELTHEKIEILSHILDATPEQEQAILKILKLSKKELEEII